MQTLECDERADMNNKGQCECQVGYAGDGFHCGLDSVRKALTLGEMDFKRTTQFFSQIEIFFNGELFFFLIEC